MTPPAPFENALADGLKVNVGSEADPGALLMDACERGARAAIPLDGVRCGLRCNRMQSVLRQPVRCPALGPGLVNPAARQAPEDGDAVPDRVPQYQIQYLATVPVLEYVAMETAIYTG
eukprot:SAG31_NODE_2610_length_5382_cov_5.371948_1_plen_118_part_00